MTQQDDFEAAINELNAAVECEFPDPVDIFEDDPVHKLGLRRYPALSLEERRRVRVRAHRLRTITANWGERSYE